jgi:hypothetical protein
LKQLPPKLRERLQKPRRVFLDTRYERSNKDFWDAQIAPALTSSQRLIVISTPDAFEPRSDGSSNWVEREIETYWAQYADPERILVALAPGAPEDRYPGKLGEISGRWDWADLRGYRRLYWLFPWRARRIEDAFAKLVAGIYDIPARFVPALRREEQKRHRRWRLGTAAGLTTIVALSGLAGFGIYQSNARLVETKAGQIWNSLEFRSKSELEPHEIEALWELASRPPVQEAFLNQMAEKPELVLRFAQQPGPVLRSLGLPDRDQAGAVLDPVLGALREPPYSGAVESLARTMETLAPELTAAQAEMALGRFNSALNGATNGALNSLTLSPGLPATLQAAEALSRQLTVAQSEAAVSSVLDALRSTTNIDAKLVLAREMVALAPKLTTAQAESAVDPLLGEIRIATELSGRLASDLRNPTWMLARALGALPVQLTADQAGAALGPIVEGLHGTSNSSSKLGLPRAVGALAPKLSGEQADAALDALLEALRSVEDEENVVETVEGLAHAMGALAPKLSADQAGVALDALLEALSGAATREAVEGLAQAMGTLAPELRAEKAQAALGPVLNVLSTSVHPDSLEALAGTVERLFAQLTAVQAEAALDHLLSEVNGTSDPDALRALARKIEALPVQLTADRAGVALDHLLSEMERATDPTAVWSLAKAVEAIAPKLDAAHAGVALDHLLGQIEGTSDPSALSALAGAVGSLPVQLTTEPAERVLGPVLEGVGNATDSLAVFNLAGAVEALAPKLPSDQAATALGPVLDALSGTTDNLSRLSLAGALEALAPRLPPDQAAAALGTVIGALSEAAQLAEISALAGVVATVGPKLISTQAEAAFVPVLDVLSAVASGSMTGGVQETLETMESLTRAVAALALVSDAELRESALANAQSRLAAATSAVEAMAWAGALEALILRQPANEYLEAVVEALKYPPAALRQQIDAGDDGPASATEYLLQKIRYRFPDVERLQTGNLTDLLHWAAQHYSIDLTRPPVRPGPFTTGRSHLSAAIS